MSPEELRIIKLHKRWADGLTVLWLTFALLLLTGFHFALEYIGIDAPERSGIMVLLAVMVLITAIWQAVGLAVARMHLIIKGINIER
jgi:RsiW-degrading membrane proteinase PrsW (M82 family)